MEPKTLFGKVLAAILDVFITSFPDFVNKLYQKVPTKLKLKLVLIIHTVENFNTWLDTPGADLITSVIPGHADDDFKEWLKTNLPKILKTTESLMTSNDPETRKVLLHSVATRLTKELTGSSFGQAAITAEVAYQNFKKK